ncbi:MAG: hypothetical protein A3B92_02625 [Candidatus Harrisonbacteria bacterium RIFCSPHIGHO2_02_FULL_42_16]|uniref:Uncharacterized protein n=1 Tax=Candidatus Harrisonbacteria bacterium RIFCSPHIGHO2_02_FULL_42_16 TaxID=1798404 RepID=A0A1G1ZKJ3_9BACT|nr:MAG: hypothetical protein A3B92_02625 [Candidatus Harrisonbacteria bacterium RIFCSPHIGHO2_02_FULL_42_16]
MVRKFSDINPTRNSGGREYPSDLPKPESATEKLKNFFCRNLAGWLALLIILALVWKLLVFFNVLPSSTFPKVDREKWQAVFLNNGQSYFGHLQEVNREYAILKDIYYLRVPDQQSAEPQSNINLVKLGSELHGPEDIMYIPKNQISFWENMRADSAVVKVITSQK